MSYFVKLPELPVELVSFATSDIPCVISDARLPDFPIIFVNNASCELTGYHASEVIGRNCRFLQGPQTDPAARAKIRAALDAGNPCNVRLQNYCRDGTPFLNELCIMPLRNAEGEVTHFIGIQRANQDMAGKADERAWLRFRRRGPCDLDITSVSPGIERLTLKPAQSFLDQPCALFDMLSSEQAARVDRAIRRAQERERDLLIDIPIEGAGGRRRWVRLRARYEELEDGAGFLGTLQDVTQEQRTSERLSLVETLVMNAKDVMIVTEGSQLDRPGPAILFANPQVEKYLGYKPEELIGLTPRIFQGAESDPAIIAEMGHKLRKWRRFETEIVNYRRDGSTFLNEIRCVPIADQSGWYTHWVSIQRDVTDRRRTHQRIELLSHFDPLTRTPNRQLAIDRLNQAIDRARRAQDRVAVIEFTLKGLAELAGRLGHATAAMVLEDTARRAERCMRAGDTVARAEGGNFLMIATGMTLTGEIAELCDRLQAVLSTPFLSERGSFTLRPSLGVAVYPQDGQDSTLLVDNAQLALCQAHTSQETGICWFRDELRVRMEDREALKQAIAEGLGNDEFELFFQPQIDILEDRVVGIEGLVRWRKPDGQILAPDGFLQALIDHGLIGALGDAMMARAAAAIGAWQARGLRFGRLALNVDAAQINEAGFAARFLQFFKERGIAPECLSVEVVERVFLDAGTDQVLANLNALRAAGAHVELDDFGTGYASLAHLKGVPVNQLKLDRSFVKGVREDPADAAIVAAMIGLAGALGLSIIAEGVESREQVEWLREHGCRRVQGFLFARPMSQDDMTAWLQARQRGRHGSNPKLVKPCRTRPVPSQKCVLG